MLTAPDRVMESRPWITDLPNTADFDISMMIQQPNELKHHLKSSCSPIINLASLAISAPPLLPPIGSISPANTTTASRFSIVGSGSILNPLKMEYCRFEGCANFSKMQGYCHDHIHGRPAPQFSSPIQTPFVQTTSSPLPTLVLPSSDSQCQYLPSLNSVVSAHSNDLHPVVTQAYSYDSSVRSDSSSYPIASVSCNKRPLSFTRRMTVLSKNKNPRNYVRPTCSAGNSCCFNLVAKCRRDGCRKEARRKGLCMEHGGRHFCKKAGCLKCAHRGGFCISHGGGRRCAVANCTKSAQSGGICYSHGGGKRCATEGCTHAARSGGFCIKHGKLQQALQQQFCRR
ncbi:hypothetical protein Plhal304r1_c047g0129281 [Plasmopara halstedii]